VYMDAYEIYCEGKQCGATLYKEALMNKEHTFIKKAISGAKALEQSLADLLLSKDDGGAFALYRDIADSLDERAGREGPFVVTDINPIKRLLEMGAYAGVKRMSSQLLPFSAEGVVIVHGVHNPGRIGSSTIKYLGHMPSWEESLKKAGRHSVLFSVSNPKEFEALLEFYRGERRLEYLRSNDTQMALSQASLEHIKVWGNSVNFIYKSSVIGACLDVLEIMQFVEDAPRSQSKSKTAHNSKNKVYAAKYLAQGINKAESTGVIIRCLLKIASTRALNIQFDQDDSALIKNRRMKILVQSDVPSEGWAGRNASAVIDGFCTEMSKHCTMSPEKVYVNVMKTISTLSRNWVDADFSQPFPTMLNKECVIKELRREGVLTLIQKTLKWDEIWSALQPSEKKHIITEELGM
jgi:hypothetical protein